MGMAASRGSGSSNPRAVPALLERHAELLSRFAGEEAIAVGDPFWPALLAFPDLLTRFRPEDVEHHLSPSCGALVARNARTFHFQKLLLHTATLLLDAARSASAPLPTSAVNAVRFVTVLLKFASERLSVERLLELVAEPPSGAIDGEVPAGGVLGHFVASALVFLSATAVTDGTYLLHAEVCTLLLVGCSTQLTQAQPHAAGRHPVLEACLAHAGVAPRVVQALLLHYTARSPPPSRTPLYAPPPPGGLRTSLLAPVAYAAALLLASGAPPRAPPAPLADAAALLLLALVHAAPLGEAGNPFRTALCDASDAADAADAPPADPERAQGLGAGGEASVPFHALCDALCAGLARRCDTSALLLYTCLHGCVAFREVLLSRPDPAALLVPLLARLYDASTPGRAGSSSSSGGAYLLVIVVLILTQDAAFHAAAHAAIVPSVPWYRERVLRRVSCGSLLTLVLCRCVAGALGAPAGGDVYLHTNCLAALANSAPHFAGLAPAAAQRLVSLFNSLARRAHRLAAARSPEADVFADLARLLLEVLNAALTHAAARNPELVYALLQRPEVFAPWRDDARLGDLATNVCAVIDWFTARLDDDADAGERAAAKPAHAAAAAAAEDDPEAGLPPAAPSAAGPPPPRLLHAAAALELVRAHAREWRPDGLRLFEQLRFTYEEEASSEEFFVPHVWSLVVAAATPAAWHQPALALLQDGGAGGGDDAPR